MRIQLWGTRGSIPVATTPAAIRRKLVAALVQGIGRDLDTPERVEAFVDHELDPAIRHTWGGNSSCVQLDAGGDEYVLCDLGSGVRSFGNHVLASRRGTPAAFHVFLSHTHWDHILGFPFFMPAYIPGNRITIYGCHAWLEEALRRQHGAPSFPVEWSQLGPGRLPHHAARRALPLRARRRPQPHHGGAACRPMTAAAHFTARQ